MAKPKKTLFERLTERYQLVIRSEDNLEERTLAGLSNGRALSLAVAFFLVVFILALFMAQTLLARWFDPRHAQREANNQLVDLTMKVDSLVLEVDRKDNFILNIQRILRGDTTGVQQPAEILQGSGKPTIPQGGLDIGEAGTEFRKEYEQTNLSLYANTTPQYAELQETFFFSPVSGVISDKFDAKRSHFGVDVVTKANEPIKAIADGTIIMSSWTQDAGYVIMVQHQSNMISVYKHNAELLKKTGTFVNAGEILSIVGNSGEMTTGPHLHFELWYNGNPVNPVEFVTF